MKKSLLIIAILTSIMVWGNTPDRSFKCNISKSQTLSIADINRFITQMDLENYRLQDHRTTLVFDNGFGIELISANEAQAMGLITNAASYQKEFIRQFTLPVFHMTPDGKVSAAYSVGNSKYSSEKR